LKALGFGKFPNINFRRINFSVNSAFVRDIGFHEDFFQ
jgi:hypothetical protein